MRLLHTAPLVAALAIGLTAPTAVAAPSSEPAGYAQHAPRPGLTDQNFYFVMGDRFANGDPTNDEGGLTGDKNVTGFDPTGKGYYNGGDLKGLRAQLDYIKGLGTDAIWLTPIFKNKPVQLEDGPSAGYHGYWITDFTQVDPHLGTNADLADLVDAAHDEGMKVFFDIITNHTADVIGYGDDGARTAYVSKDESPYRTATGTPFDDRDYAGTSGFPDLDPTTSFPYTPELDPAEEDLKVPAWLNDVTNYHNRGDTTFVGENSQYGDFFGLDDLFTEKPEVVDGMIDIYQTWVGEFGIDGFRIDTMKHVNDEFWQDFGPGLVSYARAHGKPDFFMFGEVALDGSSTDAKSFTSHYTTHDKMQAVLDFPFQDAARKFASKSAGNGPLGLFFRNDDWYTDGDSNAYELPTFLGNHDMGRFGYFLKTDNPGADGAELLARDRLAHELMYFSRGNPVVYYGDEQGFTGTGGDQLARQTMFASQVPEYMDDEQIGSDNTGADDNFVTDSAMYTAISDLAAVRAAHPALEDGAMQVRTTSAGPGLFSFSRIDRAKRTEYVVALNNSEQAKTQKISTYLDRGAVRKVYGPGAARVAVDRQGRVGLTVPALSAVVYRSTATIPKSPKAPRISLRKPTPAGASRGRMQVHANVPPSSFYEVTFQRRVGGSGPWRTIGVDDNAPYNVYDDTSTLARGKRIDYRAAVLDNAGHRRGSKAVRTQVPAPVISVDVERYLGVVYPVQVSATVDPERATQSVLFQRKVGGGPWTDLGRDSSSPAYTITDDVSDLPIGTVVRYRAVLAEGRAAPVTSATAVSEVTEPRPSRDSVTVAGDLQSELGCPADWQPDCAATHLTFDTVDGLWHGTFLLPAGTYSWKVAIDDAWTESYGAGGGGDNLSLTVPAGGGTYRFSWHPVTHDPSVAEVLP